MHHLKTVRRHLVDIPNFKVRVFVVVMVGKLHVGGLGILAGVRSWFGKTTFRAPSRTQHLFFRAHQTASRLSDHTTTFH